MWTISLPWVCVFFIFRLIFAFICWKHYDLLFWFKMFTIFIKIVCKLGLQIHPFSHVGYTSSLGITNMFDYNSVSFTTIMVNWSKRLAMYHPYFHYKYQHCNPTILPLLRLERGSSGPGSKGKPFRSSLGKKWSLTLFDFS